MVDLFSLLPEEDLRSRFGSPTVERALDYVRRHQVLTCRDDLDADDDLVVDGTVAGSTSSPYSVHVSVGVDGAGLWIADRCSCPVRAGCKHVVALLLTVRDRHAALAPDPGRRWQRQLSSLLDELEGVADAEAGSQRVPLALQVDLRPPGGTAGRGGGYRGWSTASTARGTLRTRPLRQGKRGWVRTGISWSGVPYLDRRGHHPEQVAALNDLISAHRAASRQMYFSADPLLSLGSFGPDEPGLLRRAVDTGMPLVPGPGLTSVSLHDPVTLEVDVNGAPGRDAHLQVGVRLGGEWFGPADLDVLGDGGRAVALWTAAGDRWQVVLAPLSAPTGPGLRRLLARRDSVVVPADDRDTLLEDYLPRLHRHVPVLSSDRSVPVPAAAEPRLVLRVTWVAADEVRTVWSWRYRVGETDRVYRLTETRGLRGLRRPQEEQARLEALVLDEEQVYHLCRAHRRELGPEDERTFRDAHALLFAERLLPGLVEQVEVEEAGARPDYRELEGAPVVTFSSAAAQPGGPGVPDRTDWLDLEVSVTVDGVPVALAHVLRALTLGTDRVVLRSGRHVRVDRPELARLADLVAAAAELRDQPAGGVRVGHADLHLWDELAEVGIVDAQAASWVRAAQTLRSLETLPAVEPDATRADLRPYQVDGFRWLAYLWQARLGGILADDMGLGKTLQTLALVAHARSRGSGPFLVVAPTSVVAAWAQEAARFVPALVVCVVGESQSRRGRSVAETVEGADLVVTSYTLFRLEQDDYVARSWGGLVLDEAQTVKNHHGKTYQAVRRVEVPFRLALTGTPMENRLMDLWSLLSIVAPGLYPWPQRFLETVAHPVERLGDRAALDRFRRRVRPFLLRRTKEAVAGDLPPKQEQVLSVELTPRHREVYETHLQRERQAVLGLVDDVDRHRIAIFRSLTRLRQLALDAALVDPGYAGVGSAKVDVLVDHLLELAAEGHRALVFSSFSTFLRRVRDRLCAEGIASSYLDGTTRRRAEVVEGFRRGSDPVFLISLKAGGVGLTLTEADYVFVLDPWWNPAVEAQAVDRTHRIGQHRQVFVYRLVAAGTVEEKVMELKERKAALFTRVVDGDGLMSAPLTGADVRRLFAD